MILSIDFRTDIPAFYSEWILNRFKEGFLYFRNPVANGTLHKVLLDKEHIEGIVWCSKDYSPILDRLYEITDKFPSIFHYTITPYDTDIEPTVPSASDSIKTLQILANIYGKEKVIWRYDPIFCNKQYDLAFHKEKYREMCESLNGYVDRCVINFVSIYDKVKRHMPDLVDMTDIEKETLIKEFVKISKQNYIDLQMCGNGLKFRDIEGLKLTGCIDEEVLNRLGIYPKPKNKTTEWGCMCYPNTSIGEYNTCMHKCKYCYASKDFDECTKNYIKHDSNSPLLVGWPTGNEKIIEMKPKTINTNQLSLNF